MKTAARSLFAHTAVKSNIFCVRRCDFNNLTLKY